MELLRRGMSLLAVAARVGCSPSSVVLWRDTYRRRGDPGLRARPATGRPPKLQAAKRRSLARILLRGASSYGFPTDLWTTRRVAKVIQERFGVEYHPNHLWRLLRGLGWSCQRPETRARERDEAGIEHWKRYRWPRIKKSRNTWSPSGVSR
jgi:transposase